MFLLSAGGCYTAFLMDEDRQSWIWKDHTQTKSQGQFLRIKLSKFLKFLNLGILKIWRYFTNFYEFNSKKFLNISKTFKIKKKTKIFKEVLNFFLNFKSFIKTPKIYKKILKFIKNS